MGSTPTGTTILGNIMPNQQELDMTYVFQFDEDTVNPFGDGDAVWVTKFDFWMKTGCFSDQERGVGFPREISDVLGNAMEAYFEWPSDLSKTQIRELFLRYGWKELPKGYSVWSHDHPNISNILPDFQSLVSETSEAERSCSGVMVKIPGSMPCPWCRYPCSFDQKTWIATCERNPKHRVLWEPWGG